MWLRLLPTSLSFLPKMFAEEREEGWQLSGWWQSPGGGCRWRGGQSQSDYFLWWSPGPEPPGLPLSVAWHSHMVSSGWLALPATPAEGSPPATICLEQTQLCFLVLRFHYSLPGRMPTAQGLISLWGMSWIPQLNSETQSSWLCSCGN